VPVAVLSRKIAAQFCAALKAKAPAIFAEVSADVWRREWVSFCKHYGHGNDAVLSYLSRYVFRTAITNARILDMDQTHVTFRWKDRGASAWRTERLPGVEFLRRFLQHVLPRGFHKVRYYGLWHPSKRDQSNRAWVLLILATPADPARPLKVTSLSEVLSQLMELSDEGLNEGLDPAAELPRCPHCGSCRTRLLGEYPRLGGP
jgi:Putative transposase